MGAGPGFAGQGSAGGDEVSAQVSLYPLRQAVLGPAIDEALGTLAAYGLDVRPGAMSTVVAGARGPLFRALEATFAAATARGDAVMNVTVSNACPVSHHKEAGELAALLPLRPIGHVENAFREPTHADVLRRSPSRIVLEPDFAEGLTGLEPGHRLLVLFWLHRAEAGNLLQHPRGDASRPTRGVFALRSPHRPNPIGATVVAIRSRTGHVLEVEGLDAIDGTPVLDLKPA